MTCDYGSIWILSLEGLLDSLLVLAEFMLMNFSVLFCWVSLYSPLLAILLSMLLSGDRFAVEVVVFLPEGMFYYEYSWEALFLKDFCEPSTMSLILGLVMKYSDWFFNKLFWLFWLSMLCYRLLCVGSSPIEFLGFVNEFYWVIGTLDLFTLLYMTGVSLVVD